MRHLWARKPRNGKIVKITRPLTRQEELNQLAGEYFASFEHPACRCSLYPLADIEPPQPYRYAYEQDGKDGNITPVSAPTRSGKTTIMEQQRDRFVTEGKTVLELKPGFARIFSPQEPDGVDKPYEQNFSREMEVEVERRIKEVLQRELDAIDDYLVYGNGFGVDGAPPTPEVRVERGESQAEIKSPYELDEGRGAPPMKG